MAPTTEAPRSRPRPGFMWKEGMSDRMFLKKAPSIKNVMIWTNIPKAQLSESRWQPRSIAFYGDGSKLPFTEQPQKEVCHNRRVYIFQVQTAGTLPAGKKLATFPQHFKNKGLANSQDPVHCSLENSGNGCPDNTQAWKFSFFSAGWKSRRLGCLSTFAVIAAT